MESLHRNGSEAQRWRYLPGLIDGSKIGALAITEPEAGSDALSMRTRAEKQGDHWVLNGTKLFCSQVAIRAVGKAMEVFGEYGFIREYPIQRFYRDVKGIEFGAGTNQIQRMIILKNLLNGAEPFPL